MKSWGLFPLLVFLSKVSGFPKQMRWVFYKVQKYTRFCNVFWCADALNHVLVLRETSVFPNSEDLHGAAIALVRLQDTYQLNVTDLADGHYNGVDHSKGQGFLFHFLFFCFLFLIIFYRDRSTYWFPWFLNWEPCCWIQVFCWLRSFLKHVVFRLCIV